MGGDYGVRDYGVRGDPPYNWTWTLMRHGCVALAVALAVALGETGWRIETAEAHYWLPEGPPCPRLTLAQFGAQPMRPDQVYPLDGAVFARAYGWASCAEQNAMAWQATTLVCQFTNPGVLAITTPQATTYFAPGLAQPATVILHGLKPSCIMAANFTE